MAADGMDVLPYGHEVSGFVAGIQSPGGIGHEQDIDAEPAHRLEGIRDLTGVVPLVQVDPALHHDHGCIAQGAVDQVALVAFNGRHRKMRDGTVGHNGFLFDGLDARAESGAQDHAETGCRKPLRTQEVRGLVQRIMKGHGGALSNGFPVSFEGCA